MKKILSILLAALFALSFSIVAAASVTKDPKVETIKNIDSLDFSHENNFWATFNEETGKYEPTKYPPSQGYEDENLNIISYIYDEDADIYYAYNEETGEYDISISSDDFDYMTYADKAHLSTYPNAKTYLGRLDYSFVENGEVLRFVANTSSTPGFGFTLDDFMSDIQLGGETDATPRVEYCKIRIRNYSSAQKFGFGWIASNLNNGATLMINTISELEIENNSSDWVTYTFSMKDINSQTDPKDANGKPVLGRDVNGTPVSRWASFIKDIFIFPFGYDKSDGTGAYKGAMMDIDYVVFGSEEYVTNYKSDLEIDEDNVQSIEIVTQPTKSTYYVGETLDTAGLQLKVTYKDNSTEIIDSCSSVYDFSAASESSAVTLKYGASSATFNVKVVGITSISITTNPTTTSYVSTDVKGGSFFPAGLVVNATFADGTVKEGIALTPDNISISNCNTGDNPSIGEHIVTINYYGAQTTFMMNVIGITSIRIDTPTKQLHYGEELTLDDLTITCVYSDGTEKSLTDANINPMSEITVDTKTPGDKTATVRVYNESNGVDLTATTTVTVVAPTGIEITTQPTKTEYNVDETFDNTGLVVSYVYEDGKKAAIDPADYTVLYDFSAPAEEAIVTVKAGDFTATLTATVKTAPIVTTTTSATTAPNPNPGSSSTLVIIIVVVAVLLIGGAVVFVMMKKKKK